MTSTYQEEANSLEETKKIAARLARQLKGGEVIELASDLGGGKTTFVQGLAKGLGYEGEVTSPTFTLSRIYKIKPNLELHHYDLYRLGTTGAVGDQLAESLGQDGVVTVIEWGNIFEHDLPKDRLRIELEVTGEDSRSLHFQAGGPRSSKLLEGLKP